MELKPSTGSSRTTEFEQQLDSHVRGQLDPGENLLGITAASQQKGIFSGGVVALAVTDRRLIIQPLDRRGRKVKGDPTSLTREEMSKVKLRRAGGGWDSPSDVIMSHVAITLKIKTTGGEKFQFSLMDGSQAEALKVFLGESDGGQI